MPPTIRPLAALLLFVTLSAQSTSPVIPADVQAEIARLRTENAQLRQQLADRKAQLTEKSAPPATQPNTQPAARAFTTMADILVNTPADLRPKNTPEWHKYTESKFINWFEQQLIGMTFEQSLAIDFVVERYPLSRPKAQWSLRGGFAKKPFTYFAADHSWAVAMPTTAIDESTAKKWDATKQGTLFKVKGTISAVNFRNLESSKSKFPSYRLIFTLKNFELIPVN